MMTKHTTKMTTQKGRAYYPTVIKVTKLPTRGGSAARHNRAKVYCDCDQQYRDLGEVKRAYLLPWWMHVTEHGFVSMRAYNIWMKCCLKYLDEAPAFKRFSYVTRYWITNDSDAEWTSKGVILEDIPTYQEDGQDIEVYKLLACKTVKNRITYDTYMIDKRLENETTVRGSTTAIIPSLLPAASMLVDVYSYYKPVVP